MVSVVCSKALDAAVKDYGLKTPSTILDKTADIVISDFNNNVQDGQHIKDGMDASILRIDKKANELQVVLRKREMKIVQKHTFQKL
jgi:hypothetical protein